MGTDIHCHIEVKMDGKWRHYSHPSVDRDYHLFGVMAGVRRDITPIAEPKGLPSDATYLTKKDLERMFRDAHHVSWFGVEEIDKLKKYKNYIQKDNPLFLFNIFKTFIFGDSLTGWKNNPEDNICGVEDLRIVFWFDN